MQKSTSPAEGELRTISETLNFCAVVDIFVMFGSSLHGEQSVSISNKDEGTYGFAIEGEIEGDCSELGG